MGDVPVDSAVPSKRALIYTRMSRDATGEGLGIARQLEECKSHAARNGWTVVDHISDNSISAYGKVRRPGFERVMEAIERREVDVVVCYHIDRLSRVPLDTELFIRLWEQTGVEISPASGLYDLSTDTGRMFARFQAALVRGEVERKGSRQKLANAQRRAAGLPWRSGWASFGYDRDKNIIPVQAEMIREAARDVLDGASLKSIARRWRESGVSTPRSSKGADGWTHNGVKSILLNPVNAGFNTYRGEEIGKGKWEPIITEATLRQLQAVLGDPARRTHAGNGRRAENLLSGIARCATCDSAVVAGTSNGKKVYKCSNTEGEHLTTLREAADRFVLEALTQGDVFASHRVLPDAAKVESQDDLMSELAALDRREGVITEQFSQDKIKEETWTRALAAITSQREAIELRMAEAGGVERTQVALSKARVSSFLAMPLGEKRTTIRSTVEVQLHPRNRRRNVPIDEQVTVWARDRRRLGPLVAGCHSDSLRRAEETVTAREDEKLAALGPDYQDD